MFLDENFSGNGPSSFLASHIPANVIDFNQIIIIGFSNFVLCCIPCIKNVIFHANYCTIL